jgi:hypothetical protein
VLVVSGTDSLHAGDLHAGLDNQWKKCTSASTTSSELFQQAGIAYDLFTATHTRTAGGANYVLALKNGSYTPKPARSGIPPQLAASSPTAT